MADELTVTEEPLPGSTGGGKVFRGTGPHAAIKKWFMGLIKEAQHGSYAAYNRLGEGNSEGIVCIFGKDDTGSGIGLESFGGSKPN